METKFDLKVVLDVRPHPNGKIFLQRQQFNHNVSSNFKSLASTFMSYKNKTGLFSIIMNETTGNRKQLDANRGTKHIT